jgi:hypothetical protein
MNAPLTFSFHPDADETVRASRSWRERGVMRWRQWAVWPVLLSLLVFYRSNAVPWRDMGLLYMAMLLVAVLTAGAPWYERRRVRRLYAEPPFSGERQHYEFSPDGLTIRVGATTLTLGWPAISEAREADDVFFLTCAPRTLPFLPKRAIVAPADSDALRSLLHAALGVRARGIRPSPMAPHI